MSDFDDKLGAILGDQDAMSQIMALAQSLSAPRPQEGSIPPEESSEMQPKAPECFAFQGRDTQLLAALRPYLRDSRQKKLDKTLELLQMIRLLKGSGE